VLNISLAEPASAATSNRPVVDGFGRFFARVPLWGAMTFRDARQARGLTLRVARRGHPIDEPSDPYRDRDWSRLITRVSMLGA
jgi:hypothetical protein